MSLCGGGGQAEIVLVPESSLLPVPDRIDDAALKALVRAGVKINATKKGARSPKAP